MNYEAIEKYKKSDLEYFDLLNLMCDKCFSFDFWALFNEAENQQKKIYLIRDRWKEQTKTDPTIDWEINFYKEDIGIR